MGLSVENRARAIATFRFVEVRLMEVVAAWTPTTPEMEVKVMFGRHIWDFAQHADALGKRTFELRLPEQHSMRPSEEYVELIESISRIGETAERIGALYYAILPGLERRYQRYLQDTDPILDAPSVVIIDRILQDIDRQRSEAAALLVEIGLSEPAPERVSARENAIQQLVSA